MNSRKDIILIALAALLLAVGSTAVISPGLIAPVVPGEEDQKAEIAKLKSALPQSTLRTSALRLMTT